ncbi:MAG: electron transfer flavoprotein subunit beta/FixA family protein, partial [Chloroflexi bacterium]
MEILVCIKQILDPEMPPSKFRIDPEAKEVVPPEGIPPVISPYDAQAIEASLRIKEQYGARVSVITIGVTSAANAVKHGLAMGADEGILVNEEIKGYDSFTIAHILTKAVQRMGRYDLILCGRQGADYDCGQVGPILA